MKRVCKLVAVVALLAFALGSGRAMAATGVTATLPVQASVTSGCLVATVGLNFGAVSPLIVEEDLTVEAATAQGDIILACGTNGPTTGTVINISLDNGANGAIAPILGIGTDVTAIRAMTNSTSFLAYDLFQPTAVGPLNSITGQGTCEWGSGGGPVLGFNATCTGAPGFTMLPTQYSACVQAIPGASYCAVTVYGSVPGDQVQPLTAGLYVDTVTATVTF